jgi:hypothetical protein
MTRDFFVKRKISQVFLSRPVPHVCFRDEVGEIVYRGKTHDRRHQGWDIPKAPETSQRPREAKG